MQHFVELVPKSVALVSQRGARVPQSEASEGALVTWSEDILH